MSNQDSTILPETLSELLRSRFHGAKNITGIRFQLLYSLLRAFDLYGTPPATQVQFEGLEDVDLRGFRVGDIYCQVKSSQSKQGWGWLNKERILDHFIEAYQLDPEARFVIVTNFGFRGQLLRDLARFCNSELAELPQGVRKKMNTIAQRSGLDKSDVVKFLRRVSFERTTEQEILDQLRAACLRHFQLDAGNDPLYLSRLIDCVITWSASRAVINKQQLEAEKLRVQNWVGLGVENPAVRDRLVKPLSFVEEETTEDYYEGKKARPGHILERVLKVMSMYGLWSLQGHSWIACQSAQHEMNHRCIDHGFARFWQLLIVFAQPPVAPQPGKRSLDHPTAWQYDKPGDALGTLNHLENPACQLPNPVNHRLPTVAAISPNQLQAFEPFLHGAQEKQFGAGTLLNTRLVDHRDQKQAHHIHQDVAFAPLDFLIAVVPAFALDFRGLDALAVNNRRTGLGLTTGFLAHGFPQGIVHGFPDTLLAPGVEVAVDGLPGREVVGQHAPGAATPQDIENGVDHFSDVHTSATAPSLGRGNEWFQDEPLDIGQITGVCFSVHAPIVPPLGQICNFYITLETPS